MPIPVYLERVGAIRRLISDPPTRWRWITRLTAGRSIHQDTTETHIDRYPKLFTLCRAALGEAGEHRILSFGCSSGEEVVSLRSYFSHASLVGAEINRGQLAACKALPADPRAEFIHSTRENISARGPYDAIFCMAVLQRRPHAVERRGQTNIASHYRFDRFDGEVAYLVSQLRVGGLLVVEHSQYRVEDSAAAALIEPVLEAIYPASGPRFDRAGQLVPAPRVVGRIFRKVRDHA